MSPAEVSDAAAAGALVLDLRPPRPFSAGHVPGAVVLQFNRADLADRAVLVLPPGLPLVVHAEPEPIATTAVQLLGEAGFDVRGHLEGGLRAWREAGGSVEELTLMSVDELHDMLAEMLLLDVREAFEYRHGHVPGAALLASGDLWTRVESVPADRPIATICGDQTRSAYAASVLRRAGRDARLVMGGMVDWLERGYPVEKDWGLVRKVSQGA